MTEGTFVFSSLLAARMERLVNNQYLSDISFKVGKAGEVMVAHKLIVTVASEVFHAQFNGNFADSKEDKPIEIPDIEPSVFVEILRFMYCDEVNLTDDNVVDVYYGAQKYLLMRLIEICEKYLKDSIVEANALKIFDDNRQHELAKINELCLAVIRDNPLECFEQRTFLGLQERSVELIVQCDTINCTDVQLRKAIQQWIDTNGSEDKDKLLPNPPARAMQCRRLSFHGNFGYIKDIKNEFKFTFGTKVSLYGVGLFIGACNRNSNLLETVTVVVDIETDQVTRRATETFPVKQDLCVYKLVFGKVNIEMKKQCSMAVTMKSQGLEMFYLDSMKPADCLKQLNFNLTSSMSSVTHIAYFLYNNNGCQLEKP